MTRVRSQSASILPYAWAKAPTKRQGTTPATGPWDNAGPSPEEGPWKHACTAPHACSAPHACAVPAGAPATRLVLLLVDAAPGGGHLLVGAGAGIGGAQQAPQRLLDGLRHVLQQAHVLL